MKKVLISEKAGVSFTETSDVKRGEKKTMHSQPATVDAPPKAPQRRKTVPYLNGRDLYLETVKSKEQGYMSDKLIKMLQLLAARIASKSNFAGYTYNEDMQALAMMQLVKTWKGFNPERGTNAFAYYTQCIKNSFKLMLRNEKKERDGRDELLEQAGYNPSYSYQLDHEMQNNSAFNDDYDRSDFYNDDDNDFERLFDDDDGISDHEDNT